MARNSKFAERVRLGREMKAQRDGRPYTQNDLADALTKSRNAVDAWENGRAYPPAHTRRRAADELGVAVEWLEGRADTPYSTHGTNGRSVDYVSSTPIARAMGVVREGSEVRFSSPTSAQKGRIWVEQFLLELAADGATESFLESARRLLLNPSNYEHGFGAAAGHPDEMDDDQKLKHMKALSVGVRAALDSRTKKTGGKGK